MIIGVEVPSRVIDREGADETIVEHERGDEGGLEHRDARGETRGFKIGTRARVDERPPVTCDPTGEPLPTANSHRADHVGFGTGRKTTAQRFVFLVIEEQAVNGTRPLSFEAISAIVSERCNAVQL
jgi:hypothetical protein